MERIKLSNGLVAFGGAKGVGKTRFLLKLANYLAKTGKVLFVSYSDYKERLEHVIKGIDGTINSNLELNTHLGYYCVESFLELIEYIEEGDFKTVIIDNAECYSLNPAGTFSYPGKDGVVDALLFISNRLKVRVMFTSYLVSNSFTEDYSSPTLNNFIWSREIVNQCEQIYVFYRPTMYGFKFDEEGTPIDDNLELISLKNEEHNEHKIIYPNSEFKFFNQVESQI
ncbi:MAG: hypothetical protein RBR40_09940 [Tenuifilaceae bacterium]|nr:hypothetical protein [Tenuifilaceae bacterium]